MQMKKIGAQFACWAGVALSPHGHGRDYKQIEKFAIGW